VSRKFVLETSSMTDNTVSDNKVKTTASDGKNDAAAGDDGKGDAKQTEMLEQERDIHQQNSVSSSNSC
jgi:hypothetical protein